MIQHQKRWESRSFDSDARFRATYWVKFQVMAEFLPVFQKLHGWMRELDFPQIDRFATCLVLQEALTNAVRHGHAGDRKKFIRITFGVNRDEVLVEVEDEGRGFNPDQSVGAFNGSDRMRGRGLFLMRAYSSWLSFNVRGNRMTFGRRRTVRAKTIVIAPTESMAE